MCFCDALSREVALPFLNGQRETQQIAPRPVATGRMAACRLRTAPVRKVAAPKGTQRRHSHVYFVANLSAGSIRRQAFAAATERIVPRFAAASYPNSTALLETSCARAPEGTRLVLDELSYIEQVSPQLPSIIQRLIDAPRSRIVRLLLGGTSHHMTHALVLDETASLCGNPAEIIEVAPTPPGGLRDPLQLDAGQNAVAYFEISHRSELRRGSVALPRWPSVAENHAATMAGSFF